MADAPPILRSFYANGFSPEKKVILDAMKLPPKTTCWTCSRLKPATTTHFAEKKLQDLRSAMAQGQAARQPMGKWIVCRTCTPAQVSELKCSHCDQWKGLQAFTRAQRRNPDNARCVECVADHLEAPIIQDIRDWNKSDNEDDDNEDETSNIYEDSDLASSAGGARLSTRDYLTDENLHVFNVSTGATSKQSATLSSTTASGRDNVRRFTQAHASGTAKRHEVAGNGPLCSAFVGYDAQGQAHTQIRAPSTAGSDDSDTTPEAPVKQQNLNRSNFAKVPGTKNKPPAYRQAKTEERSLHSIGYADDEDVDDEDDYFSY